MVFIPNKSFYYTKNFFFWDKAIIAAVKTAGVRGKDERLSGGNDAVRQQ